MNKKPRSETFNKISERFSLANHIEKLAKDYREEGDIEELAESLYILVFEVEQKAQRSRLLRKRKKELIELARKYASDGAK